MKNEVSQMRTKLLNLLFTMHYSKNAHTQIIDHILSKEPKDVTNEAIKIIETAATEEEAVKKILDL